MYVLLIIVFSEQCQPPLPCQSSNRHGKSIVHAFSILFIFISLLYYSYLVFETDSHSVEDIDSNLENKSDEDPLQHAKGSYFIIKMLL